MERKILKRNPDTGKYHDERRIEIKSYVEEKLLAVASDFLNEFPDVDYWDLELIFKSASEFAYAYAAMKDSMNSEK